MTGDGPYVIRPQRIERVPTPTRSPVSAHDVVLMDASELRTNYIVAAHTETSILAPLRLYPSATEGTTGSVTVPERPHRIYVPLVSFTPIERNAIRALRAAEREALVKADKGTPRPGFSHVHLGSETILEHRPPGSRQRKARKRAK